MNANKKLKKIIKRKELLNKKNQHLFQDVLSHIQITEITAKDSISFISNFLDMLMSMEEHGIDKIDMNVDEFCNAFIHETLASYSFMKRLYLKFNLMIPALICFLAVIEVGFPFIIKPLLLKQIIAIDVMLPLSTMIDSLLAIIAFYLCFISLAKVPGKVSIRYYLLNLFIGTLLLSCFVLSQVYATQPLISCNLIILYSTFFIILSSYLLIQHHINKI